MQNQCREQEEIELYRLLEPGTQRVIDKWGLRVQGKFVVVDTATLLQNKALWRAIILGALYGIPYRTPKKHRAWISELFTTCRDYEYAGPADTGPA